MSQPFFTVAIPTTGRVQTYFPETLKSVLQQSCTDFELLISDNASTDGTQAYVASLNDPRIRYIRRETRLPPAEHFAVIAQESHGRYFVLNQDDDLLHRDFLARAKAALTAKPGATVFASPIWRESPLRGYRARLMRPEAGYASQALLADEVMQVRGEYAAIKMLDPELQFVHPVVVLDAAYLQQLGGYCGSSEYSADLVTQAQLMIGKTLLYDQRPGGISRVHDHNYSRNWPKQARKRYFQRTYQELIRCYERGGMNWQQELMQYLVSLNPHEIMECLHEWVYYNGPVKLQQIGLHALKQRWGRSGLSLWKKLVSRLGIRNTVRLAYRLYQQH